MFSAEITKKVKKGRGVKQDRERIRESIVSDFMTKPSLANFMNPLDETMICGKMRYDRPAPFTTHFVADCRLYILTVIPLPRLFYHIFSQLYRVLFYLCAQRIFHRSFICAYFRNGL